MEEWFTARGLWRNGSLLGVVEEWFTARGCGGMVNRIDPVANEFNQ